MRARMTHRRETEEGAALILAVLFVLALSAVASAMVVLSRTETLASMNYKMMSQSRYAAESGVHRAINYLINAYPEPGSPGDALANYNMDVSPVTYNGQPVVLSTIPGVASNYPVAATVTAFTNAAQGTLAAGGTNVAYRASMTLLSMRDFTAFGATASNVVQTWRITGTGGITGVQNSIVEVSATLERQVVSAHTYAAFATNPGCGALSFSGGVQTDSYDSSNMTMSSGHPVTQTNGGDVGTNGNLTESGGSIIRGSLSTPRTGVGSCRSGAVTAETISGGATVTGGLITLPQAVTYPAPGTPTPLPPVTSASINPAATCASIGLTAAQCSGGSNVFTFNAGTNPVVLGNISMSGGSVLHLTAGTYNFNSINLSGGAAVIVDSGPVFMNVVGTGQGTPIDFSGGSTSNLTFDPSKFQILYGGSATVRLSGGTSTSSMVYAPNASINLSGGTDFYGSVIGATVNDSGGVRIHYDRTLGGSFGTTGNRMLTSFTWKKF
jgi:hypothetical protein